MALNKQEQTLLEAVKGLLSQDALGVHFKSDEETSHTSQFRWEGIDDAFALKVSESPFFESITSAFYSVHAHKYIDHPTFKLALVQELKSRAVPEKAIKEAVKALDGIINELSEKKPSERDAGWNPNIAEITDMTRNADDREPKREAPFTGGGPWVDGINEDHHKLLMVEGIVGDDDLSRQYSSNYCRLKAMEWPTPKNRLVQLAENAHKVGLAALGRDIERHIVKQDNLALQQVMEAEIDPNAAARVPLQSYPRGSEARRRLNQDAADDVNKALEKEQYRKGRDVKPDSPDGQLARDLDLARQMEPSTRTRDKLGTWGRVPDPDMEISNELERDLGPRAHPTARGRR